MEKLDLDKKQLWQGILESVKISVSSAIFSTWFSQTHILNIKNVDKRYIVEIGCNSSFAKSAIEKRYYALLQDSLTNSLNAPCDLVFLVKQKAESSRKFLKKTPLFESQNSDGLSELITKSKIRKGFTFDNFAVSSTNQMAWAAAEAVSKNPSSAYNPLFIWGGVGVGKTHLMNAVGYSILEKNNERKIVFCTGESFTNDIVEGIRNKSTQKVRNKYRLVDVLLIDDIQFIAGKDAVQEEFFHTFNALVNSGGQIILTSDKSPSDISKLEERLRSRFEAGLIVDIASPDFELRCAILQIKTKEREMNVPMDLIQIIAGNIDSARKIEGFLTRLDSEINLKNTLLSQNLIESLISKGEGVETTNIRANPTDVITAVSKYFSLNKRSLLGASRVRPIVIPRQILMYFLRTQLSLPFQEVGRLVGGRDHTTVMHAVDKITKLATNNVQIRSDIQGIRNMF